MGLSNPRETILAFARHIAPAGSGSPEEAARGRNWIGEAGEVTAEGEDLLAALNEQSHTRTVFRGNF